MHEELFETLADPTRRRIVEMLRGGERPVSDIVAKVGIHQSGVSRHLRLLSEVGFVSMRADGSRRIYKLRAEPFRELDAWLGDYRRLWEERLDRFGASLQERKARRNPKESDT